MRVINNKCFCGNTIFIAAYSRHKEIYFNNMKLTITSMCKYYLNHAEQLSKDLIQVFYPPRHTQKTAVEGIVSSDSIRL